MVYNWLNYTRDWLFPTRCCLCCTPTRDGHAVCHDCYQELPWLPPGCKTCAAPLPTDVYLDQCESCQRHRLALDSCHALFNYRAPVDRWIRNLKFHQELSVAKFLGHLLAERVPKAENSKLVPVPLHRSRLRQRGFNQALEIARPLKRLGYHVDTRCCIRNRHTPPQSELAAAMRRQNMRNAFSVRRDVAGQDIVLIDDVLTTGATLNTLAGSLKQAGAAHVDAWVIARTPEPGSR
jgi:ComF family protein